MPLPIEVKILVIDDEPKFQDLAVKSLRKMDIAGEIVVAQDGEEAYQILSKARMERDTQDFQFVCCDINMPKVSGLEFLTLIRSEERYKNLPVLMLTSESAMHIVSNCIKAGCSNYLVKPWDTHEDFVEKVNASWNKHNS